VYCELYTTFVEKNNLQIKMLMLHTNWTHNVNETKQACGLLMFLSKYLSLINHSFKGLAAWNFVSIQMLIVDSNLLAMEEIFPGGPPCLFGPPKAKSLDLFLFSSSLVKLSTLA